MQTTAEQLIVRGATRADLDAVVALETLSFPVPWRREFFVTEIDAIGRFNIVATTATGELVGYVFAMFFLDEMHVNKIAVEPSWRRKGIAILLMEECFAFARRNGVASVSLEVRESNAPARALYRSIAFVESYTRPRYYPDGESAIVMTCELAPGGEVA
ncbi:MAG: ribosomal protein S18-alanine N-acetyltransferase [Thermoanaerobaculia bacterium]|nr:ribosomal protein S18-alanine N-acetyltransferase [Thermoanaerobaculia bacterium]